MMGKDLKSTLLKRIEDFEKYTTEYKEEVEKIRANIEEEKELTQIEIFTSGIVDAVYRLTAPDPTPWELMELPKLIEERLQNAMNVQPPPPPVRAEFLLDVEDSKWRDPEGKDHNMSQHNLARNWRQRVKERLEFLEAAEESWVEPPVSRKAYQKAVKEYWQERDKRHKDIMAKEAREALIGGD